MIIHREISRKDLAKSDSSRMVKSRSGERAENPNLLPLVEILKKIVK